MQFVLTSIYTGSFRFDGINFCVKSRGNMSKKIKFYFTFAIQYEQSSSWVAYHLFEVDNVHSKV
jgi:hypothetical protein